MQSMRAARLVARGRMECERVQARAPAPGEALVRTRYAAVCGSDLQAVFEPVSDMPYPLPAGYPGHEGIGHVVHCPDSSLSEGQPVLTVPAPPQAACFADYQTLDADHCLPLPEGPATLPELLVAQQLGTIVSALALLTVDPRDTTCAVVGHGAAGMLFAALLKRAGARRVVASDYSSARRRTAAQFGTDECVPPHEMLDAVLDETAGRGADVVIEAVGCRDARLSLPELVSVDGAILCFGLPDANAPEPFDYATLFRKRARLRSAMGATGEAGLHSFRTALESIATREVDVRPLLTHTFPIESINEGLRTAYERDDEVIKVCVDLASP